MTAWRARVSPWVPPAISAWAASRSNADNVFTEFTGTWDEAVASVRGYGDPDIAARVAEATRSVERGEAAFERDSVLFSEPEYSWPLLAALLHAAAVNGRLSVLDFGGALGSTYRQHRAFLDGLPDLTWTVVEQAEFVALGQREFQTSCLRFAPTITDAVAGSAPNVVLLGSSLQYMENPRVVLAELTRSGAGTLVIDRTPLSSSDLDDTLCIQTVPATIYPASYPMWVLSRRRLIADLSPTWRLLAEYESGHGRPRTSGGREFTWDGLIMARS